MDQDTRLYYQQRERTERAAAMRAESLEARRVHQQLAQNYGSLVRAESDGERTDTDGGRSRLTVLGL